MDQELKFSTTEERFRDTEHSGQLRNGAHHKQMPEGKG